MKVTVDGAELEVADGTTILEAAKLADRWVPTLCYDERQQPFGACRVCLVAVGGAPKPLPARTTPCRDGMEVDTTDERARRVATAIVELVLSELPEAPAAHTELAQVAERLDVSEPRWPGVTHRADHDLRHPYLAFQHELCISCGRCVRACDEVQGAFALTATGRGFTANIAAGLDSGFLESACVSCGACADSCPTDAITEITLLCGYCGVGCRLEAHADQGRIKTIAPALDGPANEGHTCLKGRFAHQFTRSRDRLTSPLIREGGSFRVASWDEALQRIVSELTRIKSEHGPDAIAGLASSRATNEDCYAMQRMMRAAIGTNNIDNCSRVCHSPTSFALRKSFGLSGATGSFTDIDQADVALLLGVNPTQGHPVVGARIKQAALRGCKLITIDPRRIELADYGVIHLSPRPGTNAAIVLGLSHVIRRDGLTDPEFIAQRTEGYEAVEELLEAYTPEAVREITGIPAGELERAAHIYGEAQSGSLLWGLGVTEHKYGSEVVQLLCNLALMTGKVGKPGSALLPLRGQNNVQGSSDMGALPDTYTAYRPVSDEATATLFEEAWGVSLSRDKGYTIPQMFDAAVAGDLKAMYIFGEDVAQTDPDTAHVTAENLEFMVCQEIFENETTKYADVVLPASAFLEKEGTFTNAERRFQAVNAAIDPPGGACTDFDIITTVSRMLGHEMDWTTPWDATDEIARVTPAYAG
jgi:formate dehydrogenase major subunit